LRSVRPPPADNCIGLGFGDGSVAQSPHASANSLDRAKIWFLAACSLSS